MSIKLIASDIDGTILNQDGTITPRTQKIVKRLKDYGIHFTLATGRSYESSVRIADQLNLQGETIGLICLNGMFTYGYPQLNTIQKMHGLSYEQALEMQELGEKFYMGIMYCFSDTIYFQMDDLSYEDFMIAMRDDTKHYFNKSADMINIKSLEEIKQRFEEEDIQKIAYVQSPMYMDLVIDRMKRHAGDAYDLMRVGLGWTEVGPKEVNKGQAVLNYAKHVGVQPDEIMVFGDSENDISMFKIAKKAIAMDNALENVKRYATDHTLNHNDDGVADYIERYLDTLNY